jgi:hypothetical protein
MMSGAWWVFRPGSCVAATCQPVLAQVKSHAPELCSPGAPDPGHKSQDKRSWWQQRDDEKPRAVNSSSGGARWLASAMDPASWLSWSRRTASSAASSRRRQNPRPARGRKDKAGARQRQPTGPGHALRGSLAGGRVGAD